MMYGAIAVSILCRLESAATGALYYHVEEEIGVPISDRLELSDAHARDKRPDFRYVNGMGSEYRAYYLTRKGFSVNCFFAMQHRSNSFRRYADGI